VSLDPAGRAQPGILAFGTTHHAYVELDLRADADVDRHVEDLADEHVDELALPLRMLEVEAPVFPAQLRNRAGIVGAAMAVAAHVTP